jgi:hypothetical protein
VASKEWNVHEVDTGLRGYIYLLSIFHLRQAIAFYQVTKQSRTLIPFMRGKKKGDVTVRMTSINMMINTSKPF